MDGHAMEINGQSLEFASHALASEAVATEEQANQAPLIEEEAAPALDEDAQEFQAEAYAPGEDPLALEENFLEPEEEALAYEEDANYQEVPSEILHHGALVFNDAQLMLERDARYFAFIHLTSRVLRGNIPVRQALALGSWSGMLAIWFCQSWSRLNLKTFFKALLQKNDTLRQARGLEVDIRCDEVEEVARRLSLFQTTFNCLKIDECEYNILKHILACSYDKLQHFLATNEVIYELSTNRWSAISKLSAYTSTSRPNQPHRVPQLLLFLASVQSFSAEMVENVFFPHLSVANHILNLVSW